MVKITLIFFITLYFIGCNINTIPLDVSKNDFYKESSTSHIGNYLTANYSITKGDAYTASKILDKNLNDVKLLEIKFFSNLVSGNFGAADKISLKLKVNNNANALYNLPQYILKIKNNDLRDSLNIFKNQKLFFNLDDLNNLIKLWIKERENSQNYLSETHFVNSSIHKLLILENFYSSDKLIKIADSIYKNNNLNSYDFLLLAGFYFRVNDFEKSKEIIKTKLPSQFDKNGIINTFNYENNKFNKIQNLNAILASKIYNLINEDKSKINEPFPYQKILLEFSLFLESKMDISKYALAEIYNYEKTYYTGLKILDSIPKKSFYSLAANLKKLTVIKTTAKYKEHKDLLFKIVNTWPDNKFVLYRLASYYKSKEQHQKSLKIYKKILDHYDPNDRDLFLYASNLDKVGKWKEARVLFLKLLKKNPRDTFTLNYVSYKLALKNQELELALNLIKKALVLDPNNGYFLDTLGWVEYKRNNFNSAVYFLEKSVSILPRSAEVIDHLGDCYFMLNRKKEAVFEWKKALKYETDKNLINKIKEKIRKNERLL